MNRRQVLSLVGSAAFAGCIGGGGSSDPATRTTTEMRRTETTTTQQVTSTDTTEQTTTEQTTTAELPEVGEPLPSECPVPDDDVDRIVCYPGTDAPLALRPSSDSVSLPTGGTSFTLSNDTDATFETNFYGWRVYKQVEGEWYHLAPGMWPQPLHFLPSGESHTWRMTIDNTDLDGEIRSSSSDKFITLRGLGGGTYAFAIDGWFTGQSYTNSSALAAQFTLDGDPVSLSVTDSVESIEQDSETVTVRMADSDASETLTVTQVDDPPETPERVITEQVLRNTPLRNALAVFEEGVATVQVENVVNRAGAIIYIDERRYIEYEGETYLVEQTKS